MNEPGEWKVRMNHKMYPLKKYPGFHYSRVGRGAYAVFVDDCGFNMTDDMESAYTQVGTPFPTVRALKAGCGPIIEMEKAAIARAEEQRKKAPPKPPKKEKWRPTCLADFQYSILQMPQD